jgi:ATP-dependent RNA helicase SUPV3L1/SUV3
MLRVDLVERLAKHAFEAKAGKHERAVDEALATSLGLRPESVARLMRDLGFRATEGAAGWVWKGRARPRRQAPAPVPGHAFAGLASLRRG